MNYKQFFEENDLKLQICPPLLECLSNRLQYIRVTADNIIVKVPLSFKGTLYQDNLKNWIAEYSDLDVLTEKLLNEEVFGVKRDGKVYPYIVLLIEQEVFLFLDRKAFDAIIESPRDFELDPTILTKVDLTTGAYKCEIIGSKTITKKNQQIIEKALDFPMKDYNDIYDVTVKVN